MWPFKKKKESVDQESEDNIALYFEEYKTEFEKQHGPDREKLREFSTNFKSFSYLGRQFSFVSLHHGYAGGACVWVYVPSVHPHILAEYMTTEGVKQHKFYIEHLPALLAENTVKP